MAYGLGTYAEDSPHQSGDSGVFILGVRQVDDQPMADSDGDYATIKLDEEGRLKVATKSATFPLVSGTINTSGGTSLINPIPANSSVSADVSRCSNVMVQMTSVETTLVGHVIQFEASLNSTDGINGSWVILQAVRSNANSVSTNSGTLTSTPTNPLNYAWECSVNAFNYFRIRATSHSSGSCTWSIQRGTYATEPIPGIQTTSAQAVSGTITASNCTGSIAHSTATAGNPVFVGGTVVAATIDTSLVQNDRAQLPITSGQQVIVKPFAPSETTFQYATPVATPVTTTTAIVLRTAGGTNIRNHLTNIQLINTSATAGAVSVQDGTTVIWSTWLPATMTTPVNFTFDTPLRGTANTALNFVANVMGMSIFVSGQGYQGF